MAVNLAMIKAVRIGKGYSQQDVADYLGVSKQCYSNYETGSRKINFETALKIGEFLNLALSDFGYTEPTNYITSDSPESSVFVASDMQLQFFRKFCGLPPNDQQRIIDAVDLLYAERENKIALDLFAKLPPEEKEKVVQMIRQMYPD